MSDYVCGGCGCGCHSDYKEDCYFYNEEHDMGARIPWCGYDGTFKTLDKCPNDCKNYIEKREVYTIVKDHVKEKNRDHG